MIYAYRNAAEDWFQPGLAGHIGNWSNINGRLFILAAGPDSDDVSPVHSRPAAYPEQFEIIWNTQKPGTKREIRHA